MNRRYSTTSPATGTKWHRGYVMHRRLVCLATLAIVLLIRFAPWDGFATPSTGASQPPNANPVSSQAIGTPVGTPESVGQADVRCSQVLATGDSGDACVAFVHAVPALAAVNISIAESTGPTTTGIAYGEYADYIAVAANDVTIEVTETASPDVLVSETPLTLQPDLAYVLVLEQAYNEAAPTVTAVPIDLAPLEAGSSRVAFHHSVSDADELAVMGLAPPSDAGIAPGETTDPITLSGGASSIDVVPGNDRDNVLATLDIEMEPGLTYLIILGGTTGDQSMTVIYATAPVVIAG